MSKYTHWQLAAGGTWKSHATNLHTDINSYLVIDGFVLWQTVDLVVFPANLSNLV